MAVGDGTPGPGRPKGARNRAVQSVRETIARVAHRKAESIERWLDQVAAEDPGKALDLFLKMVEYHIPKLARSEVVGDENQPLQVRIVRFSDAAE